MMWNYLNKEIWHLPLDSLPPWKRLWIVFLRITVLISQGFTKSQIQQGASSLTYYSLLASVPVIALLVGLARGFQFETHFSTWLLTEFSENKEVLDHLFRFAIASLEKTQGGVIAVLAIILFLWAAIKILLNIEFVLNQIWEVKKGRSIARRFTDYITLIFLAPITVFLLSGFSGLLSASIHAFAIEKTALAFLLFALLKLLPLVLTCLLLTFLYIFIPNTRVRFFPALTAGIITGIIFQIAQELYFHFQIGVSNYNAIYGTLAALPLFLIWLHLSWVIVLLGAKVTFAIQNAKAYEFISEDIYLSHKCLKICSLRVVHLCIQTFEKAAPPLSLIEMSNALSIPLLLTTQLVDQLAEAGVLVELKGEQEALFQPALSTDLLTIKRVLDMIDERGEAIPLPPSKELSFILNSLEEFSTLIERSSRNTLLKEI